MSIIGSPFGNGGNIPISYTSIVPQPTHTGNPYHQIPIQDTMNNLLGQSGMGSPTIPTDLIGDFSP